ncbi:MAG TPA: peptidylprolyl isomerase [Candidatus Dormibacteraeota bacterium]|nr:peptidylprolyl isomerase [Candidatus Dormibacteraeota bacterium]
MSQSLPDRHVISRRRSRRAPAPPAATAQEPAPPIPWAALVGLALIVAVVAGAGYTLGRVMAVQPTGAFKNCRTATQLGPHTFTGVPKLCIDTTKTYVAKVNTSAGEIDIVMLAAEAPVTVNNFIVLAVNGYYTGLPFHRVSSTVVQGGDPLGDGRGGPGYTLPPEPNAGQWTAGAVGMARDPDGRINGSQFFMLVTDWPNGGPGDTVFNHFGTVLGGSQILSQLKAGDRILGVSISIQ